MWYRDWFQDDNYLAVYAHRDEGEARHTVDLFEAIVRPEHSLRILDLGCGNGRHAIEFARRGHTVTGVDLSGHLLERAREQAASAGVTIDFRRMDMRQLAFDHAFDAAVSLFTSFGYFETDDENEGVLRNLGSLMEMGGWFMLDFLNSEQVHRSLIPRDKKVVDGASITQERSIHAGRINKIITVISPQETRRYHESVRLFTPEELCRMLIRNGFSITHRFGDYDATPSSPDSPRLILFGRKFS